MVVAGIEHCTEEFLGLEKEGASGNKFSFLNFSGCYSHTIPSTTFAL